MLFKIEQYKCVFRVKRHEISIEIKKYDSMVPEGNLNIPFICKIIKKGSYRIQLYHIGKSSCCNVWKKQKKSELTKF